MWRKVVFKVAANGLGLAEGVEFEIQMSSFAPKPNRITKAEFSNRCHTFGKPLLCDVAFRNVPNIQLLGGVIKPNNL